MKRLINTIKNIFSNGKYEEQLYQRFKKRLIDDLEVQVHPRGARMPLEEKYSKA